MIQNLGMVDSLEDLEEFYSLEGLASSPKEFVNKIGRFFKRDKTNGVPVALPPVTAALKPEFMKGSIMRFVKSPVGIGVGVLVLFLAAKKFKLIK